MAHRTPWLTLFLIDVLLVVVFAALGRQSHEGELALLGILQTAAPFLGGLLLAALATRLPRTAAQLWPAGVAYWFLTVALGLGLRLLTGATAATAFIVVATLVLGLFLLGRRLVAGLVLRRNVRGRSAVN